MVHQFLYIKFLSNKILHTTGRKQNAFFLFFITKKNSIMKKIFLMIITLTCSIMTHSIHQRFITGLRKITKHKLCLKAQQKAKPYIEKYKKNPVQLVRDYGPAFGAGYICKSIIHNDSVFKPDNYVDKKYCKQDPQYQEKAQDGDRSYIALTMFSAAFLRIKKTISGLWTGMVTEGLKKYFYGDKKDKSEQENY